MPESHLETLGGPHIKEVDYNDLGAQLVAIDMLSQQIAANRNLRSQATRLFSERLLELRQVMVQNLIYTDPYIAAEREWHLRQPWTD